MSLTDLYNSAFSEEEELEKTAEIESEDMEKIASDYVSAGRFMARGFSDEMEKFAGGKMEAVKRVFGKAVEMAKAPFRKGYYQKMGEELKAGITGKKSGKMAEILRKLSGGKLGKPSAKERMKLLASSAAVAVPAAALAGGAAYAGKRGYDKYKSKKKK